MPLENFRYISCLRNLSVHTFILVMIQMIGVTFSPDAFIALGQTPTEYRRQRQRSANTTRVMRAGSKNARPDKNKTRDCDAEERQRDGAPAWGAAPRESHEQCGSEASPTTRSRRRGRGRRSSPRGPRRPARRSASATARRRGARRRGSRTSSAGRRRRQRCRRAAIKVGVTGGSNGAPCRRAAI